MKMQWSLLAVLLYLGITNAEICKGVFCTGACSDINECAEAELNDCSAEARCVNTFGSYKCICRDGYSGDGNTCEPATCFDGRNGGCGNKDCTETGSVVKCSCDTFLSETENPLLARGKRVTMSSQYPPIGDFNFEGNKVVDGIYTPEGNQHEFTSIAHTAGTNLTEWIQIDLGQSCCIAAVKIWNRIQYESVDRFRNVLITIGETIDDVANTATSKNPAMCSYYPGQPSNVQRFDCATRMFGRFIRVTRLNHAAYLNLYEIEVIGFK